MTPDARQAAVHQSVQIGLTLVFLVFIAMPSFAGNAELTPREQEIEVLSELFSIAAEHRRSDDDGEAWDRLYTAAATAIDEDIPPVINPESDGYDPAFEKWARNRGMSREKASYYALFGRGMRIKALAYARDERANPLFRRALRSGDTLMTTSAVIGLVANEDIESIPAIEKESERDPNLRYIFGALLMSLDHPKAQEAAIRLIGDQQMAENLQEQLETVGSEQMLFGSEIRMYDLD